MSSSDIDNDDSGCNVTSPSIAPARIFAACSGLACNLILDICIAAVAESSILSPVSELMKRNILDSRRNKLALERVVDRLGTS